MSRNDQFTNVSFLKVFSKIDVGLVGLVHFKGDQSQPVWLQASECQVWHMLLMGNWVEYIEVVQSVPNKNLPH